MELTDWVIDGTTHIGYHGNVPSCRYSSLDGARVFWADEGHDAVEVQWRHPAYGLGRVALAVGEFVVNLVPGPGWRQSIVHILSFPLSQWTAERQWHMYYNGVVGDCSSPILSNQYFYSLEGQSAAIEGGLTSPPTHTNTTNSLNTEVLFELEFIFFLLAQRDVHTTTYVDRQTGFNIQKAPNQF